MRLTQLVAKRPHRLVLDLANVMLMDCAGITHIARQAGPPARLPRRLADPPARTANS